MSIHIYIYSAYTIMYDPLLFIQYILAGNPENRRLAAGRSQEDLDVDRADSDLVTCTAAEVLNVEGAPEGDEAVRKRATATG